MAKKSMAKMRYAAPVRVSGATGPNSGDINGVYLQWEGESSGGRPVYKKVDDVSRFFIPADESELWGAGRNHNPSHYRDGWIEYWTQSNCWHVKPHRGKNCCWMLTSARDAVVVEEVTGGWKVSEEGVFKEQAGVKVMRYAKNEAAALLLMEATQKAGALDVQVNVV